MQEKVVYLLGAGFSAPRGLPVMNNFIDKSKELYNENPERYKHFSEVFSTITKISIATKYFETNLYNIEEILSILEMRAQLEGTRLNKSFRRYIADVIAHYTPPITPHSERSPSTWDEFIFGSDTTWNAYGQFVASLHNLTIEMYFNRGGYSLRLDRIPDPKTRYDVISLNYDLVLENLCVFLNDQSDGEYPLRFQRTEADTSATELGLPWLVKLHGSVDSPVHIIPPTWSKSLTKSIEEQWKVAHRLLTEANHIRVLGYSLPTSDTYIQYLLKSSVVQAEFKFSGPLKSFDVITKDGPDDKTRGRYENLVKFKNFQFANAGIEGYLSSIKPKKLRVSEKQQREFTSLEEVHQAFMKKAHPTILSYR